MLNPEGLHSPADESFISAVRQAFENAGFDETRVLAVLDCASFPPFRERRRSLADFLRHTADDTALNTLIRAFVLGEPVPLNRLSEAARPAKIEDWKRMGLIAVDGDQVCAGVEISPASRLLLASDWNRENAPIDSVMSPSASTRALEQMMIRRRSDHTLDIGTGCGVLALSAAGHSRTVFATDVNERAVRYAAFNAKFNRIDNVNFASGDLFQPVENAKFDLILCNPPFLIGPKVSFLHSSTDMGSDHFSEQLVRRAPAFLKEVGFFQMVTNWAQVEGHRGQDRVTQWFENSGCDSWVLTSHSESAEQYAHARSREMFENEEEANALHDEWLEYLAREKVEKVHFGVITMRRRSGESNWVRYEQLPAVAGRCGDSIEQGFLLRDFLDKHSSDDGFLNARLKCSDIKVEWNERGSAATVSVAAGLKFAVNLDQPIVEFIRSCNGSVPLRDQLREIAARSGQPVSQLAPRFIEVVRRLVQLGFVVPVEL